MMETLAWLDQLRGAIRAAAVRAAELEGDFTARSAKLQAQFDEPNGRERVRSTVETERLEAETVARRQSTEAHFEARQKRITRAHENVRQTRLAEVESSEGQTTHDVQHGLLEADRVRDTENQ